MARHADADDGRWRFLPFLLALTLTAAACGGASETTTPAGGGGAEETPVEEVQPDPSMPTVEVSSLDSVFEPTDLEAPARQAFQIVYENEDPYDHNVSVYPLNEEGLALMAHPIFLGEIFDGPKTVVYEVPKLEQGRYLYQCDVHGGMEGYLTAA